MSRLDATFSKTKAAGKTTFVSYIMCSDPNPGITETAMSALCDNGVDVLELGMPFSDPMAEGPTIQIAASRALEGGHKMAMFFDVIRNFRKTNQSTPIVAMGYFNPIYIYGRDRFCEDFKAAGGDAMIVVDLPAEMDHELCDLALQHDLPFIRLVTPATLGDRLDLVLPKARGFVYYVSLNGVTGVKVANPVDVADSIAQIKEKTDLPVVVGFGINTAEQAGAMTGFADGVVVGSAFVKLCAPEAGTTEQTAERLGRLAATLSVALQS